MAPINQPNNDSVNMDLDEEAYDAYIERMRATEYPALATTDDKNNDTPPPLYLDHAATTLPSKTHLTAFHADMLSTLHGNPHSASPAGNSATRTVDDARMALLRFCRADPEVFDLVFVANATAGIKVVMEAFRARKDGFWYGYHGDAHTSLVGVREAAGESLCFETDEDLDRWFGEEGAGRKGERVRLLACPAQSNMNGRRMGMEWCRRARELPGTYSLLDAAAFASTSAVDLADVARAPDFTVLSLYKIFGFPDLGALIVRKDVAHLFQDRGYFGGGTVDMVVSMKEQWHIPKSGQLHERLEDGTLPVHSIIALRSALTTHERLYGSMDNVARHTGCLANELYDRLVQMKHGNGFSVCTVYKHHKSSYDDSSTQGPIIAFNLRDSKGKWISNTEVDKLTTVKNISLRTGGLCNPGGIASALQLGPWEMRENFSAGFRCGGDNDIMNGKPTGVIRVSFGAMSTKSDVNRFLEFVEEFFVDQTSHVSGPPSPLPLNDPETQRFHVESMAVYPIKSCAGWQVPHHMPWSIHREGLAWDREWCIIHQGTGKALSQKQIPAMALIRPALDFKAGVLRITAPGCGEGISVPLSKDPTQFTTMEYKQCQTSVCGDAISAQIYKSSSIAEFFNKAIGVPCTLARFPASTTATSGRHSKIHLQNPELAHDMPRPILLSNESPILTISRSSLNRLNEQIKTRGGKAAHPSVFRANIVLAESPFLPPGHEQPYAEDAWQSMRVGGSEGVKFDFLGGCRRCQMVCIDQGSGVKNQEPFCTLAKTRRFGGRVMFGVHTALVEDHGHGRAVLRVGDAVETF